MEDMSAVPAATQILVIGGGPAGSYAATVLAREGLSVVLLEAARFPRYHIGESLLPSIRAFLNFIDAEDIVNSHGFTRKPGAAFKFNQFKREGYTDFLRSDKDNFSWNVIRSEFDDLLLKHASKFGVKVFDATKVSELHFAETSPDRPVAASWKSDTGTSGRISFDYLVDASGRNGIMSTKYLRSRHFNSSLNNVACWGYWENAEVYMPGTSRENAIWIEALKDESGWAWFIPLHNGSVSVGVVMSRDASVKKKAAIRDRAEDPALILQKYYLDGIAFAPGVSTLLQNAVLRGVNTPGAIKSASDYSYSASCYAGDHFRLAGDAGAFIDPFFSTGVHLAFVGGLSAAITISSSIRGSVDEQIAGRWHNAKVGASYTRFLLVVLGTYQQIRNQDLSILSDVDEDNFDRAFNLIRPVIQGSADVDSSVTEAELQKTMEFCWHIFGPTDERDHAEICERLDPSLTSSESPILSGDVINSLIPEDDANARLVLRKLNARKSIHTMYSPALDFATEVLHGFRAVLERGRLELQAA